MPISYSLFVVHISISRLRERLLIEIEQTDGKLFSSATPAYLCLPSSHCLRDLSDSSLMLQQKTRIDKRLCERVMRLKDNKVVFISRNFCADPGQRLRF